MGGDDAAPVAPSSTNNMALLADLLGGAPSGPGASSGNGLLDLTGGSTPAPTTSAKDDIMSLFGGMGISSTAPVSTPSAPAVAAPVNELTVYNKNGLLVTFHIERTGSAVVVHSKFRNTDFSTPISGLNLQIAVPKSQQIQFQAPLSSTELTPGAEATQAMRVLNSTGVSDT